MARIEALRGARPNQLERLITEAVAVGLIVDTGGVLTAVLEAADETDEGTHPGEPWPAGGRENRPLRLVAVDFESVVRTTAAHPYTDRRAFQVAALRFGRDWQWVFERRSVSQFCTLPDVGEGAAWQIANPSVAARHSREAVNADVWLGELDAVLEGADMVVAYNGLELDFPLLDEERRRARLPPLSGIELVDGLILALSLWPTPPNDHRLARVAERLEVDLDRYTWHEALSDCRLLATIVWAGARAFRRWTSELADVVLGACDDSPVWNMVADLARMGPSGHRPSEDEVAALLAGELAAGGVAPRRAVQSDDGSLPPSPPPVRVPSTIVGGDGRIDPHLLAEVSSGLARKSL